MCGSYARWVLYASHGARWANEAKRVGSACRESAIGVQGAKKGKKATNPLSHSTPRKEHVETGLNTSTDNYALLPNRGREEHAECLVHLANRKRGFALS